MNKKHTALLVEAKNQMAKNPTYAKELIKEVIADSESIFTKKFTDFAGNYDDLKESLVDWAKLTQDRKKPERYRKELKQQFKEFIRDLDKLVLPKK